MLVAVRCSPPPRTACRAARTRNARLRELTPATAAMSRCRRWALPGASSAGDGSLAGGNWRTTMRERRSWRSVACLALILAPTGGDPASTVAQDHVFRRCPALTHLDLRRPSGHPPDRRFHAHNMLRQPHRPPPRTAHSTLHPQGAERGWRADPRSGALVRSRSLTSRRPLVAECLPDPSGATHFRGRRRMLHPLRPVGMPSGEPLRTT
jgi:hypothetical protein